MTDPPEHANQQRAIEHVFRTETIHAQLAVSQHFMIAEHSTSLARDRLEFEQSKQEEFKTFIGICI